MTLVDLTHPLGPSVYNPPGFPPVRIEQLPCPADAVLVDTEVSFVVHVGTHVDAPRHLAGRELDAAGLALEALIGPAVVWEIACAEPREIEVDELRAARPQARPGDQVYVCTGWDRKWGDAEAYAAHPHLAEDAAVWLVSLGVALVGIDTPTPDLAVGARPADFAFPVHRALLGADIPIAENVAGLRAVAGQRFTAHVCPVPLVGADGAPARVFARLGESA
jgi:arylformamidase